MRHLRRRLQGVLTVVVVGAAVGGCGDTLVDHRNTGVRDAQQPTTCGPGLVQCGTECRSQVVGDPGWVCGTSCTPCPGAPPASASLTCTPVGEGGHDGVCGFQCSPGSLGTVSGCSPPALVAAGGQFSCATAADTGEVHCWGANDQGQLGPGVAGASRDTSGKVQFAPLVGVTALAAGPAHACAAVGGTVYCWGDATGWGGSTSSATPVAVDPLSGVTTLAAGAKHTCGIAAGVLKCAGADVDGGGAPTLGGTVLEIAAGDRFSCALVDDGSPSRKVKCWGADDFGQRGGGSSGPATGTPATIPFPPGAPAGLVLTHVAAGARHACATTNQPKPVTTAVFCWGDNAFHQLGINATAAIEGPTRSNINKPMSTTSPTVIEGGGVTTCAVKEDPVGSNFLQCWGGDATAGGGGTGIGELIDLTTLDPPGAFSVGAGHACIVDPAGKLACWGHGAQGQLGNGGAADSAAPVSVLDR